MGKKIAYIKHSIEVDIDSLAPNPWNINKTTNRQQEAIAESLEQYGQVIPILCRKKNETTYEIIDGEHRYKELKASGATTVVISVIENITNADAKKLSLILNETRGQADKKELGEYLAALQIDFGENVLIGLPFDQQELDRLISLSHEQEVPLDHLDAEIQEINLDEDENDQETHQCPKCGYIF